MNQFRRLLFSLSLLWPITSFVYPQPVGPGLPPGKWWKNPNIIEELRLSSEQQAKIESVWMESRKTLIDQKAELDKCRIDLSELLLNESVDEFAALKAFDQVQAARTTLERTTFAMQVRIRNLLSAEQQQKIEQVSARLRQERARLRQQVDTSKE